ncbi:hypothetical protein [Saccharothrix xinjiangensis]|uniref:Uncharacterized protein n=1 Tax=Saccharothrix xinjiangensis TaxID=204798 RepID=A0ABV9XT20_9PSEU
MDQVDKALGRLETRVSSLEQQVRRERVARSPRALATGAATVLAVATAMPWVTVDNRFHSLWGLFDRYPLPVAALLVLLLAHTAHGLTTAMADEVTRWSTRVSAALGAAVLGAALWLRLDPGRDLARRFGEDDITWTPATWLTLAAAGSVVLSVRALPRRRE